MSVQNKAIARHLYDAWSKHNVEGAVEKLAANYVNHSPPPKVTPDVAGLKSWIQSTLQAFPDLTFSIDDEISEGDLVMTRWTARGTHKAPFMGAPATGKKITVTGVGITRVKNGKSVESWSEWDKLGMMQQIGIVPALKRAAAPA